MIDYQHSVRIYFTRCLFLVALLTLGLLAGCLASPLGVPQHQRNDRPNPAAPNLPPSPTPPAIDSTGPRFLQITASSKVFVKSDCIPTAITVTAIITDPVGVGAVLLWYRVGADQPFTQSATIAVGADRYVKSVKGIDVPGSAYGVWEFYLTARDGVGNQSQSPVDTSVQLLPCVN